MPSCSTKSSSNPPTCSCLLEAYRSFPAEPAVGEGCDSPNCPVRSLDGITLHQFLEAIGGPEVAGDDRAGAGVGNEIPIFRIVARRRKRQKSRRKLDR